MNSGNAVHLSRPADESYAHRQLISVPVDSFARDRKERLPGPKVLDLFAGAGGFSLGFELAGFKVESAVEIDDWACQTLSLNHPGTQVVNKDISTLSDQQLKAIANNCDVIIGGPPCQGFSIANKNAGDPTDPRNSLFREFVRAVAIVQPQAVLLENVPGLLRRHAQSGDAVIAIIVRELEALGYEISYSVLEAQSFGVPQIRPRLFVVGYRKMPAEAFPRPTHIRKGTADLFSEARQLPFVSLWDAISDLPLLEARQGAEEIAYDGPPHNEYQRLLRADATCVYNSVAMNHSARMVERFSLVKWGESGMDVPEEHQSRKRGDYSALSGKGYSQNNRRMHPDKPCHTIPASFYANFIHPYNHRNFTPREGARLQSFPDWYRFCGKPTVVSTKLLAREERTSELHLCQYNQIGNAVPPLLAYQLARHIASVLKGPSHGAESR